MSDKLKIYACNGLEDGAKSSWEGEGTSAITNTQAENIMLSYMNMYATEYNNLQDLTEIERTELLNNLDLASVGFHYAKLYKTDKEKLHTIGLALQLLMDKGNLSINSDNMDAHAAHVDEIIENVDSLVDTDELVNITGATADWWEQHVVKYAKVGIEQGIGAPVVQDYGDLNKYLYDGGTYFLYLFIPDKALRKLPPIFTERRKKQQEIYTYCLNSFTSIYGTKEDMDRVIRSGIIKDFKDTPEHLAERTIKGENVSGLTLSIAIVLSALLGLLATIIGAVLDYAKTVAVLKYTPPEDAEVGTPDPTDYDGLNKKGGLFDNTFLVGAVVIAGILMLTSSKK